VGVGGCSVLLVIAHLHEMMCFWEVLQKAGKTYKFCNFVSMKTGTTIIAHPTTSEQVAALKAFVKALKIKFEIKPQNETYDPAFVEKILQGDKDFESGNFKVIKTEDLWK